MNKLKYLGGFILAVAISWAAYAGFDPVTNFGIVTVSTGYDGSATSVVLNAGQGAILPATSTVPNPDYGYNLTWYDDTGYPGNPSADPNVEIVRVTARSTDTLTVRRAQEGTTATTKNTSAHTYKMILALTKNTYDQMSTRYNSADFETWYVITTDFICQSTAACSDTPYGLRGVVTGTGSVVSTAGNTGNGEKVFVTGTTILSNATIYNQLSEASNVQRTLALSSTPQSFKIRINPGSTGTTQKLLIFGLTDTTIITTGGAGYDMLGSGKFVGFRVSEAGSVSQVYAVVKNGVSGSNLDTQVDTGITDASTYHIYECVATSTAVNFYVDGTWLSGAPIGTANIPTAALGLVIGLQTLDTNDKRSWVDWVKFKAPRI